MSHSPVSIAKVPLPPDGRPEVVAAFYKFVSLDDPASFQAELATLCREAGVRGTILLAREGINGTVSGRHEAIAALFAWFGRKQQFSHLEAKFSFAKGRPFYRMKLRLKNEIVTMGEPDVDPAGLAGTYVQPKDWNALIHEPGTLVIDTRNDYEVAIGRFDTAVDPKTATFREFPDWVKANLDNLPKDQRPKAIAMYCTGGIRCEKATSYLVAKGYENIFHLAGGILKYLETVPPEQSAWQGECFVFDQRVSVGHGLEPGPYELCNACRMPLSAEEKLSTLFEPGVSCPKCHGTHDAEKVASLRERQRQIDLARKRGETHMGKIYESTDDA